MNELLRGYRTLILGAAALCAPPVQLAWGQFETVINVPPDPAPAVIDSDTQLNLFADGMIDKFFDAGSPKGTSTNVEVNVSGGSVGDGYDAYAGSFTNIAGGVIGGGFIAHDGSLVDISAGNIGSRFSALDRSIVNISGGTLGSRFTAENGSTINLFGTQFTLSDTDITDVLEFNEAVPVFERGVPLSGVLADGSPFHFDLNSSFVANEDLFRADALVTVTLVPEFIFGDYNRNGLVDAPDYNVWRDTFGSTTELAADGNLNGIIDAPDYIVWRDNFGANGSSVPEPHCLGLSLVALLLALDVRFGCRRRVA